VKPGRQLTQRRGAKTEDAGAINAKLEVLPLGGTGRKAKGAEAERITAVTECMAASEITENLLKKRSDNP
jgi:hypothetical protein